MTYDQCIFYLSVFLRTTTNNWLYPKEALPPHLQFSLCFEIGLMAEDSKASFL